jgi:D-beta-D-heptose 7-phosphate kinase/D-beta-D-heptose 1-phosphate adenosyltransferase
MKFVVIGDIMVDKTIYGEVNKISPEAPVPVIDCKYETNILGGAANVARNLVALGHEVIMGGYVGDLSMSLFAREQYIDTKYTIYQPKDNIKLRYVDIKTGYHLIRVDDEDETESYGPLEDGPWKHLDFYRIDGILLSDYNKGALGNNAESIMKEARVRNIPVFVDTRRDDISAFKGANWMMPNANERNAMLKFHNCKEELDLIIQFNLTGMVVTLSEEGMYLVTRDGKSETIPATQKNIVDVTGAGDTALATFAVETAGCKPPMEAMKKANENAGIVCTKRGTATI